MMPTQCGIGISISFRGTVRADTGLSEGSSSGVGAFHAENAPALPLAGAGGP